MPISMRRAAEKLSRGIVLKRHLPREFSRLPIYVSPESSLRYWLPLSRADRMLYCMAKELVSSGDVVWDVGANVGLFSLSAAARTGRSGSVLAIEPDEWLCGLLKKSALTSPAAMTVLCAAASDKNGTAHLEISRCRASNRLSERGLHVACFTLDSLLDRFPPPSVLKIDVETHELKVLHGAVNLLEKYHPRIWCEVAPENSLALFSLLRHFGYRMFAAAQPSPRSALTRRASWDTLALPA